MRKREKKNKGPTCKTDTWGTQVVFTFYVPATRQARFYDFNVYSEKKLKEKLEYMHENPIKRRLVTHPKDWPWSSWAFYAKRQDYLIPIDVEN